MGQEFLNPSNRTQDVDDSRQRLHSPIRKDDIGQHCRPVEAVTERSDRVVRSDVGGVHREGGGTEGGRKEDAVLSVISSSVGGQGDQLLTISKHA